ncbi:unnamed protein product, partial [Brassica rapa]
EENQRKEEGKQTFMVTIEKDDPLYGVLNEDQVGVDKATGRRKINPEVLQQMREYILAAEGGEKRIRQERVRKSVSDLDNDPIGQKKFLRLEAPPVITNDVDKGKGFVFGYSKQTEPHNNNIALDCGSDDGGGKGGPKAGENGNHFFFDCSTGFSSGFSAASSSGTTKIKVSGRHRPPKKFRRQKAQTRSFKFDKRMVGKQKVRECIMEAWKRQNGNDQRSLSERFGCVRRSLGRWKRECSNNSKERLCGLRYDLEAEY